MKIPFSKLALGVVSAYLLVQGVVFQTAFSCMAERRAMFARLGVNSDEYLIGSGQYGDCMDGPIIFSDIPVPFYAALFSLPAAGDSIVLAVIAVAGNGVLVYLVVAALAGRRGRAPKPPAASGKLV